MAREYGFAADRMLKRGQDVGIQTAATDALATVAGPTLIAQYRESDADLTPLTSTLARTVTGGVTTATRRAGLRALGAIGRASADAVVDSVHAVAPLAAAIGTLLQEDPTDEELRAGVELVALLALRVPEQVSAAAVRDGLHTVLAGVASSKMSRMSELAVLGCVACVHLGLGSIEAATDSDWQWLAETSNPCDALIKYVQTADGQERWTAFQTLGELVATHPDSVDGAPDALIERVQITDGDERQWAVRVLGRVSAVGLQRAIEQVCIDSLGPVRVGSSSELAYIETPTSPPLSVSSRFVQDEFREFAVLAEINLIGPRVFLEGVTAAVGDAAATAIDFTPYPELDEPTRLYFLQIVATVISDAPADTYFPALREQFLTFLNEALNLPAATRLAVIAILAHLDDIPGNEGRD